MIERLRRAAEKRYGRDDPRVDDLVQDGCEYLLRRKPERWRASWVIARVAVAAGHERHWSSTVTGEDGGRGAWRPHSDAIHHSVRTVELDDGELASVVDGLPSPLPSPEYRAMVREVESHLTGDTVMVLSGRASSAEVARARGVTRQSVHAGVRRELRRVREVLCD